MIPYSLLNDVVENATIQPRSHLYPFDVNVQQFSRLNYYHLTLKKMTPGEYQIQEPSFNWLN